MSPLNPLDHVVDLLKRATHEIPAEYFRLPVTDIPLGKWRERVYCYELYHQLRCIWSKGFRYSLGGEVDKISCPNFRETKIPRAKPDLLVHSPGNMRDNLAVIEVKPTVGLSTARVRKDIRTLKYFKSNAGYEAGVPLVVWPKRGTLGNDPTCSRKRRSLSRGLHYSASRRGWKGCRGDRFRLRIG